MNIKTIIVLFLLSFLMSCASNNNNQVHEKEEIHIYPEPTSSRR